MELIYKAKKPETILRFMQEENIPSKILEVVDDKLQIYVGGQLKSRKDTIKKGDKITFVIKPEVRDKRIISENKSLDIIYEDPYLLILNKPKNLRMMISKNDPKNSLANRINYHYEKNEIFSKIHYVTRLDREASGCVVVAKHKFISYLLKDQIKYHLKAILDGVIDLKEGTIPLPIKKGDGSIKREIAEGGDECFTQFKVIEDFNKNSLVDVWLERKLPHQVRVHFAYFFTPVVGDKVYGNEETTHDLMLYNYKVDFTHPITDETIQFVLDEPTHFKDYLNTL